MKYISHDLEFNLGCRTPLPTIILPPRGVAGTATVLPPQKELKWVEAKKVIKEHDCIYQV
jgi:hypothetical protein